MPARSPRSLSRSAVCLVLTGMLVSPSVWSASGSKAPSIKAADKVDAAALVLDRFTFGARPGELQQVRAMGAAAWLEQQLQPERLDDSALEQRLNAYPALRMTQADQIARYPTPAMVRRLAKSDGLPQDGETRAILQDQVEFYQMRQETKAANGVAAAPVRAVPVDGIAATGTRSQLAGGATTAAAAMEAAQAPTPVNLEQTVTPAPQDRINALLQLPPATRYQHLLQMPVPDLIAVRKGLRGGDAKLAEGMTPLQKETLAALAGTNRMLSGELFSARLLRDIYSSRQLEAVMTDFWLNHFNVYIRKNSEMPSLLPEYEETVRAHALGRFEDLLEATAKSPAMLLYLDNAQSVGPDSVAAGRPKNPNAKKQNVGLNENYARELMELHTLGVNGGYTQKDVTEVAKVFTGWGIERPGEGGEFVYNDRRHQPGSKQVLGTTIKESGESEGESVLHMLATSPATAHFLSLELAQRFVSDNPPQPLVDGMAKTFQKSGGDIRAVLRAMVHAPEFFTASTRNAKIKTPVEYVVSAVRATDAEVQNPLPLAQSLERLGMPLYGCQVPTGYKWDQETWLNSAALINRMNFALLLSANKINGTTIDTGRLTASLERETGVVGTPSDPAAKERVLEAVLLPQAASAQTRQAILSQTDDDAVQQAMRDFGAMAAQPGRTAGVKPIVNVNRRDPGAAPQRPNAAPDDRQASVMLGLLLGSPEFQRR